MTFESGSPREFTRSSSQKMIGGVCGGVAEYFGWDVNIVRLATVAGTVLTGGTVVLIYLAGLMLMPLRP
ncbi:MULTISPECIES: PspC domain-containing protein [Rhodococcus]|jgi:phage shock protein C|uniref:PspC domain-containing protein n=1 Tax=Rhodococcus cerastii TaxID=908616 RepID=A0ABU4D2K0_9NOCA|nr:MULTISPECIES: PspC domain-containing protein [Rhodococcus]KAA0925193.1 PspC domain-containing protein [Rhodococcus sp. ANT_H53B]KZF08211.1 PspC family transcriptional regulator [Rhodococcus sp. EPR-147]KZF09971.1 PspC family transcriptional regulator [Rhodococcus sp. EPR-279]MDI6628811.1 PspC domain-containing protein [Rhodococcus sp. (in: high G+C Gram-positive bacteria)]MDV6303950.1 PspC domain-containing protein [Rhodococcus cerastii]